MENEKLLRELDSFRFGTLAALASLKAAIQETPNFNQTVLEDCVSYFLANPSNAVDKESFEGPLRALLADRTDFLKAVLHR
ncbi:MULTISPECIES: hypothetical protein [Burkholderia]|uniref:hypothetical protein n=1 Tax=Burkholderia TaxID=32008 RepID=UPI00039ED93F|nr:MULTISPECIES: hypothetical protein [Burkholderia]